MEGLRLDPSRPPPPIMERAYQLADTGQFENVDEICRQLSKEGYEEVFLWFEWRAATRANLVARCRLFRSKIEILSAEPDLRPSRGAPI